MSRILLGYRTTGFMRPDPFQPFFLPWWFPVWLLVFGAGPAFSQSVDETSSTHITRTETTATVLGPLDIARTDRNVWGLDEADWNTYLQLMDGPYGLWYPHLAPAFVLGIAATRESERERFARQVWQQERQRMDQLLAFNRSYQRLARAERGQPGFRLLDPTRRLQVSRPEPIRDRIARSLAGTSDRLHLVVRRDCAPCQEAARQLVRQERPLDVWYVGARSNQEIRRWARDSGIPVEQVQDRTITLNHDRGQWARSGFDPADLPALFRDPARREPVPLPLTRSGSGP